MPAFWCRRCHEQPGSAIDYVMLRDGAEFDEAVEWLARHIGLVAGGADPDAVFHGHGDRPAHDARIPGVPAAGDRFGQRGLIGRHMLRHVDEIAERIRTLGAPSPGSYTAFARLAARRSSQSEPSPLRSMASLKHSAASP